MSKIIGVSGRAGAGKDAAATFILQELWNWQRYSFAGPLKDACCLMFGWTRTQLEDRVFKEAVDPKWGFSPRRAMQLLGTEYGRGLREDLWLHMAAVNLEKEGNAEGYVITDARFENEADFIRSRGGIIMHIVRPNLPPIEFGDHASEKPLEMKDGDMVIYNDGTLDDLQSKVAEAVLFTY